MVPAFARLLSQHRAARRVSQEQLGFDADVSPRHLSRLENGHASPSRELVLALGAALRLELRERNALLLSAGFAPAYPASPLDSDHMAPVHRALELLLEKQEPYPAVVIDRGWNLVRANGGARRLLARFVDAAAVPPEVAANLVRLTLHPRGLRPSLVNWAEVAAALVERLQRAAQAVAEDAGRHALVEEVRAYPDVAGLAKGTAPAGPPAASLHLRRGDDELRLFALLTTVGAPLDVTAEELAIESFFPVDEASARWLRAARSPGG